MKQGPRPNILQIVTNLGFRQSLRVAFGGAAPSFAINGNPFSKTGADRATGPAGCDGLQFGLKVLY